MPPLQTDAFQMAGQDIPWLLTHWAAHKPDHPLLVWEPKAGPGRQWTYREFLTDVRRIAAGLAANGVTMGDKVLIHADNCPEAVLGWYACAMLGAAAVTTNTRSVAAELRYFVEQDPPFAMRVLTSRASPVQSRCVQAIRELIFQLVPEPALPADDLAYIIVRVTESFLYRDQITGDEIEIDAAIRAIRLLLTAPPSRPGRGRARGA